MKTRKHVCIYSPVMMAVGGIETHLINTACHLAGAGWQVDFCAKQSAVTRFTAEKLASAGVKYHRFPQVAFFKHTLFSSSLLYTNSQGSTSPLIWRISKSRRKGFHHCHTACSPSERRRWTRSYLAFILKGPPLVACSESTARSLRELNPHREIRVMPYFAVSQDAMAVAAAPRHKAAGEKLHFGFVGRLEASKGLDVLIQASLDSEFADICWHIFGDGSQADLVRSAASSNLVFHGAFDRGTPLSEIYDQLDAVVLPSQHAEGSPLCLIEAMAHGKPWIAFDRGGIKELVADTETCITPDSSDFPGFASAVRQLRARIREGSVSADRITGFYQKHFSCEAVATKWEHLCLSVLQGHGVRS
jgi:glycosyltransferase involved in cell wall biosynthesis